MILTSLVFLVSLVPRSLAAGVVVDRAAGGRKTCTVTARGDKQDDVPNILKAFDQCGQGGNIIFPEGEQYYIAQRLNPKVVDVTIDWRGTWLFSEDIDYWRNNNYHVEFQNHAAGFVLSGDGITIDGHNTGGINGNGDVWYSAEAGTTRPGRPMPFVFWNVSDVHVSNFSIHQPQLWAINIMNGTDMWFKNMLVNATSTKAPARSNWVQNTDGFAINAPAADTMDARNVHLENFWYKGGDDCIAIKSRSYQIQLSNVTCNGGNGIAIGSLGQYLEDSSVDTVHMKDFKAPGVRYGVHIKTWMGGLVPQDHYESGGQPRGGGWGTVNNITFENFDMTGATRVAYIDQNLGDNSTKAYAGTSKMLLRDIVFRNFSGRLSGSANRVTVSGSRVHPSEGIYFYNMRTVSNTGVTPGEERVGSSESKGPC
ncbi:hypothetical protein F66182_8040 [Fusarium sp. NRRL 66182]|nr:hypothetical protein F66182_8040 [Fusarium sp. NRRL 66182]